MTAQTDYTPEEWTQLISAPAAAGMLVISSDPSLFGSVKESYGVAKAIAGYAATGGNELVRAIATAVQTGQKPQMPEIDKSKGSAGVLDTLITFCKQAAEIVNAKSADRQTVRAFHVGRGTEGGRSGQRRGLPGYRRRARQRAGNSHYCQAFRSAGRCGLASDVVTEAR